MTDKEKKDLRIELKSRQIVLHKLIDARNSLTSRKIARKIAKIVEERQKREAELSEYDDLLSRLREGKEALRNEKTAEEIADEILSDWIRITEGDIESLRFDLLSDEKKEEIRQRNYEIAQRREERRKNHDS